MADKKVKKRKKDTAGDESDLSSEEKKVAKYLRFNLETKKATLFGNEEFYFFGSKAVDFLLDSKWAKGGDMGDVNITHRDSAVAFLGRLLQCGLLTRVHLTKTEKKVKVVKSPASDSAPEEKGSPRAKKDGTKKVKKKVKVTLEPHDYQTFLDSDDEAYVWVYDPVSWTKFILGIGLVVLIIVLCLFPLWPTSIREYSWYLSVAGTVFVGVILVLAVLRYIIFGFVFVFTAGRVHFWLLPNLTEECGFFESFFPLYIHEEKLGIKKGKKKAEKNNTDKESKSKDGEKNEKDEGIKNEIINEDEKKSDNDSKDEDWVKVSKSDTDDRETEAVKC